MPVINRSGLIEISNRQSDRGYPDGGRPLVSILIAARDEEETILACLQAIVRQLDTSASVEVLIGDDQSSDQTRPLVAAYIADKPSFRLVDISENQAGLTGKANVLAQLVRQAQGHFLFFTDADTQVSPDWIAGVRRQFVDRVGVVTGVTLPDGPSIFHKLQTIDWLYNLTLTHLVSSLGLPITAMGNNMAVRRDAYEAVGGYESLPVSVVEDYTLFRAIVQKEYRFRNLLDENVLALTKPVDTVYLLLQQRKRWMRGAVDLPAWMVIALFGQYLAGPLLLLLGLFMPMFAVMLYVTKLFLQTTAISFGLGRLRRTSLWPYALLFEIYQLIIGPVAVLFYLLPTRIEWKGRTYK